MALILHPSHILCLKPKPALFHHSPTSSKFITRSQESSPKSSGSSPSTSSQGQGFGPKLKAGKKTVIRRAPVENPQFVGSEKEKERVEEQFKNESWFLLTWSGLGAIILLQGIALSASGFLPEDWDRFLVKYLYPIFTPTVFLFVAGSIVYGGLKYFENEKLKNEK